jgi:hypothetical protein
MLTQSHSAPTSSTEEAEKSSFAFMFYFLGAAFPVPKARSVNALDQPENCLTQ